MVELPDAKNDLNEDQDGPDRVQDKHVDHEVFSREQQRWNEQRGEQSNEDKTRNPDQIVHRHNDLNQHGGWMT